MKHALKFDTPEQKIDHFKNRSCMDCVLFHNSNLESCNGHEMYEPRDSGSCKNIKASQHGGTFNLLQVNAFRHFFADFVKDGLSSEEAFANAIEITCDESFKKALDLRPDMIKRYKNKTERKQGVN